MTSPGRAIRFSTSKVAWSNGGRPCTYEADAGVAIKNAHANAELRAALSVRPRARVHLVVPGGRAESHGSISGRRIRWSNGECPVVCVRLRGQHASHRLSGLLVRVRVRFRVRVRVRVRVRNVNGTCAVSPRPFGERWELNSLRTPALLSVCRRTAAVCRTVLVLGFFRF